MIMTRQNKKKKAIYHGSNVSNLLFLLFFRIMGFIKAIYPRVTWKTHL